MTGSRSNGDADRHDSELLRATDVRGSGSDSSDREGRLSPGQNIAGRYTIVRLLGAGGMGEVYEAEDHELLEHVALKIIRSAEPADSRALVRFKREIQLARRVTHPNVCRIYDVSHHVETAADDAKLFFVSMELLRGRSLRELLVRRGRLNRDEALPIALQICAGLAAAHSAGVIHRDLKSDNVMIVDSGSGSEPRVAITDFGLAQPTDETVSRLRVTLTNPGEIVGTPAYMSPEQVEGGELTAASDIYSLGVVLFEMITGRLPFEGDSPLSVAARRLTTPPPVPSTLVRGVGTEWDDVVLRCLARDPRERFGSAAEVADALREATRRAPRRKSRPASRWKLLALLAGLALSIAIPRLMDRPQQPVVDPPPSTADAPVKARRSVAVLGFRNVSGDANADWISTALSEFLTSELAIGESLRCVPGETVARLRSDVPLDSITLAADTLRRLRTNLGTDVVVLGSYLATGDQLRLDVRVQDTTSGALIRTLSASGPSSDFLRMVNQLGGELRQQLGARAITAPEAMTLRAAQTSDPEAMRLYADGVAALRAQRPGDARVLLERAIAADPSYAMSHVALTDALTLLGREDDAQRAARKAAELAHALSREERLIVEARAHETSKDWKAAEEVHRGLFTFFPDNLEYGLRLAGVQIKGGNARAALETVARLRRLPNELGRSPQIDILESMAADALSDYPRAIAAARRAAARGMQDGSNLVIARAKLSEGGSLKQAGKLTEAAAATREAAEYFERAHDPGGVARALSNTAVILYTQGDLEGARKAFGEALATHREIGHESAAAKTILNLGTVLHDQADVAGARDAFAEAARISRAIGEQRVLSVSLNNLAFLQQTTGDLASAAASYEEALTIARAIGDRSAASLTIGNLGDLARLQGDFAAADRHYAESLRIAREIGEQRTSAYLLYGMGEAAFARGDLAAARRHHSEALKLRTETGEQGTAAESNLALGLVALEEGRLDESQQRVTAAIDAFRAAKMTDNHAAALAAMSRLALARGETPKAQQAIAEAEKLLAKSENRLARIAVALAHAQFLTARGVRAEAATHAQRALTHARASRLKGHELEARLTLASARKDSAALRSLATDADRAGYRRIAARARTAAQSA